MRGKAVYLEVYEEKQYLSLTLRIAVQEKYHQCIFIVHVINAML